MNRRHLLTIGIISLVGILLFTAYSSGMHIIRPSGVTAAPGGGGNMSTGMGRSWTFETAVEVATDIVVAEFVARRPFGQSATEYEFIVHDRIFGNAADTIFVYVVYDEMSPRFAGPEFQFTTGTQYLLTLMKLVNVYASFHHDGFMFHSDLILDLNNPSRGTMHNQSLSLHSNMNFDSSGLTRERIISYVRSLPRAPFLTADRVFVTSDTLGDIINDSPYVLIIEINEPRRMASQASQSDDIQSTDIYSITVVDVLKGDMQAGDRIPVIFFAGTVFTGETHLVSITPSDPEVPYFYRFTSRHSLHTLDQRDDIIAIIAGSPYPIPTATPYKPQ